MSACSSHAHAADSPSLRRAFRFDIDPIEKVRGIYDRHMMFCHGYTCDCFGEMVLELVENWPDVPDNVHEQCLEAQDVADRLRDVLEMKAKPMRVALRKLLSEIGAEQAPRKEPGK